MFSSIHFPVSCEQFTQFLTSVQGKMSHGCTTMRICLQRAVAESRSTAQNVQLRVGQLSIQTRAYVGGAGNQIRVRYTQFAGHLSAFSQAVIAQPRVFAESARTAIASMANQIMDFAMTYKAELFFVACSLTTAILSPGLFFSSLVITVILRVITHEFLKKKAGEYLKDEKNPFLNNPTYGPHFATPARLTAGIIGAVDAIALTSLSEDISWVLRILPLLGGIAAGNVIAEASLDIAHHINARLNHQRQEQ
jgi:hypothetical protein